MPAYPLLPGLGLGALPMPFPAHLPRLGARAGAAYPAMVDLRSLDSPIRNQGGEGACASFSTCGLADYWFRNLADPAWAETSEQAVYYWCRQMMGTVGIDSGTFTYYAYQVLSGTVPPWYTSDGSGAPGAALWPYSEPETLAPTADVVADSARHRIGGTPIVVPPTLDGMRASLAAGRPYVITFPVFASWYYSGPQTRMTYPLSGGVVAYHAVMVLGYDDATGYATIRNSWGTGLGDSGYFYFPYDFLTNYCSEGLSTDSVTYNGVLYPRPTRVVSDAAGKKLVLTQRADGTWRVTGLALPPETKTVKDATGRIGTLTRPAGGAWRFTDVK